MDSPNKNVVITYETLFELLKREKDRTDLQKLDPQFFLDVVSYLREKNGLITKSDQSYEDTLRAQRELDNIRKLIKELYDRREKKIIGMALDESRTQSNLFDLSLLLPEERELYQKVTKLLSTFRKGILTNILNQKAPALYSELEKPSTDPTTKAPSSTPSSSDQTPLDSSESDTPLTNSSEQNTQPSSELSASEQSSQPVTPSMKMVRFLHDVPKFVGPELEEFGPFSEDDIAQLPSEVVDVLLSKERVEEINQA